MIITIIKPIKMFKTSNLKLNQSLVMLTLMITFCCQMLRGQSSSINEHESLLEISISDSSLWDSIGLQLTDFSKVYILDHGVELNLREAFKVHGIQTEIIQKNQIEFIGNQPLVQIHTLNVDTDKALVRIYLMANINGTEKNSNASFQFIKKDNAWLLTNTSN